ncbi:hypothetical protein TNCV_3574721 [Trichonephila clavipes]|nr:hypothetical protein TNCV_3574721 [Trichonephila clavipes]
MSTRLAFPYTSNISMHAFLTTTQLRCRKKQIQLSTASARKSKPVQRETTQLDSKQELGWLNSAWEETTLLSAWQERTARE